MKKVHVPARVWAIVIFVGWSALLFAGAYAEHHGWGHPWHHLGR